MRFNWSVVGRQLAISDEGNISPTRYELLREFASSNRTAIAVNRQRFARHLNNHRTKSRQ